MSYDGCSSDAVVVGAMDDDRRQRRGGQVCQSFTCISPWIIVRRWISGRKARATIGRNWGNGRKIGGNLDVERKLGFSNGLRNQQPSSSSTDVSELSRQASFNLGVGFGLIYLVAASKNELNKMVELQKKIETLLRNLQIESRNHDDKLKHTVSSSFSNTAALESVCTEENESGLHLSSSHHGVQRIEKSLRMDRMEAELEAEFDSLQVQMDQELHLSLSYSKQKHSEIQVEESAPERSRTTCFDEHMEHEDHHEVGNEYYSVPPRELERRLHELLEARQEERINELETSLDRAMQHLGAKERELSWWKDTARLMARHLPPVPNLVRQVKQGIDRRHELELQCEGNEQKYGYELLVRNHV